MEESIAGMIFNWKLEIQDLRFFSLRE